MGGCFNDDRTPSLLDRAGMAIGKTGPCQAMKPPSMTMVWPVTNEAASESR